MQLDGGWIFAAGLAARLRSTLERVSLRCAVALFSITLRVPLGVQWSRGRLHSAARLDRSLDRSLPARPAAKIQPPSG